MKKQNLLMYAFVAFLFICLLVKPFWTFPMWDAFVIAISCASYFFAFGDYFNEHANRLFQHEKMHERHLEILRTGKPIIEKVKRITNNTLSLENSARSEHFAALEVLHSSTDILEDIERSFETQIKYSEKSIDRYNKGGKRYQIYASFVNAIGFVAFLCVLTFFVDSQWLVSMQDSLSAWAFAIIMLTQCLKLIDANYFEKDEESSNQLQLLLDKTKGLIEMGELAGLEDSQNAD